MSNPNLQRLSELAAADPSLVVTLIDMFFEQFPALNSDLEEKIRAQNSTDAKASAHTLKGVCLNLGFDEIAASCKAIEDASVAEDFTKAAHLFVQLNAQFTALKPVLEQYKTENLG